MLKTLSRLALIGLLSLFLAGCGTFPWRVVRLAPTVVPPRGPAPIVPPTPVLPILRLEYAGNAMAGERQSFNWTSGGSGMGGSSSGSWPPHLPGTLTVPAGTNIDIVVSHSTPPAAMWVVEIDSAGVPTSSTALAPTTTAIPYTLSTGGSIVLQVMAQWTYQNYVTYLFAVEVKP